MPIKTSCPQCQASFELPDRLAGKTVRCQKCQATFKVPELEYDVVLVEPQSPNPIVVVDPPKPADDGVVATMAGPPPADKEEEIVTAKLVERAATAPKPMPTPSPRSRRPTPAPTGNTGTGAIIAVVAIGLFACLLLVGGGGAVFFLVLKPREVNVKNRPIRDDARFNANAKVWPQNDFDQVNWNWGAPEKWQDKDNDFGFRPATNLALRQSSIVGLAMSPNVHVALFVCPTLFSRNAN